MTWCFPQLVIVLLNLPAIEMNIIKIIHLEDLIQIN